MRTPAQALYLVVSGEQVPAIWGAPKRRLASEMRAESTAESLRVFVIRLSTWDFSTQGLTR